MCVADGLTIHIFGSELEHSHDLSLAANSRSAGHANEPVINYRDYGLAGWNASFDNDSF